MINGDQEIAEYLGLDYWAPEASYEMDMDEYQDKAEEFALYPADWGIFYPVMGLTGEAGEVADKIKKLARGDTKLTPEYRAEICKEMGDVLWYLANLAGDLGLTLSMVAEMNLEKLETRKNNNKIMGNGDNR